MLKFSAKFFASEACTCMCLKDCNIGNGRRLSGADQPRCPARCDKGLADNFAIFTAFIVLLRFLKQRNLVTPAMAESLDDPFFSLRVYEFDQ